MLYQLSYTPVPESLAWRASALAAALQEGKWVQARWGVSPRPPHPAGFRISSAMAVMASVAVEITASASGAQ